MVDYAIVLLPTDRTMYKGILEKLRYSEDGYNINQTGYTPVKYRPITVNIKVKVPGEGGSRAKV